MSPTAAAALERLWSSRGFDIDDDAPAPLDRVALFGRAAPLVLEIGCGMGEAIIAMASVDPARDYLGVDVHTPGLGTVLVQAESRQLTNVAVARGDALVLLRHCVSGESLDAIHVFFPDPWPKARHHKRRIIQPGSVALMRDRLRVGGVLHTATDWDSYAVQMREVLTADPLLREVSRDRASRPVTKFEQRGTDASRDIHDVIAVRTAPSPPYPWMDLVVPVPDLRPGDSTI